MSGNETDLAQTLKTAMQEEDEKVAQKPTSLIIPAGSTVEHAPKEKMPSRVDEIFDHLSKDELEEVVVEEPTSQAVEESSPQSTEESFSTTSGTWKFSDLVPKDYEQYEHPITFWSGDDPEDLLLQTLMGEFADIRCRQPESNHQLAIPFVDMVKCVTRDSWKTLAIFLPEFFIDDTDACFVVRGSKLHMEFLKEIWGAGPWKGRCFITPMMAYTEGILLRGVSCQVWEKVKKSDFRGKKHQYFFDSAVEAWKKVELDPHAAVEYSDHSEAQERVENVLGFQEATETNGNSESKDDGTADEDEDEDEEDDEMDIDDTELLDGRW
ncbi:uncharacterized protein BDZ99DRAFT_570760 [Mytilinidion resinicola]|uniref:Uncharacterized protein n=1 Tax=Mytilinidion resinicola TaxID=574789 RepID=A0A6A6YNK8_9PEZI|nr:uncharacterized protein BDZ99DRAFT_570760 [Mytilinidion resinicola]KAF2810139.1 hypothetical protein BDZ99DRAFT_570760 [Mytilinidion resinicola]